MFLKKIIICSFFVCMSSFMAPANAQLTSQFLLIKAVEANNIEKVKEYIVSKNMSPDIRRKLDGAPLLLIAVEKRSVDAVRVLLDNDANINITSRETRETALMRAAELGNKRLIDLLLSYNPDVNMRDSQNETALLKAVRAKKTRVVSALLAAGASTKGADLTGKTAMDYAQKNGSTRMVNMLESAGDQ